MKLILVLLVCLFFGSLDGFSQVNNDTTDLGMGVYMIRHKDSIVGLYRYVKPDTLRAICLVSLFQNGISHARMGYVVIAEGKEVVYLDCRKRALKLPQVGWGYRLVNPNERVR